MGISPIYAIPKVLEQAGLTKEDVDVYEVRVNVVILFFKTDVICYSDQ